MNTGNTRIMITGILAIFAVVGAWQILPGDDSAMLAELKSMNKKIDDNTLHLTARVNDLEKRLANRSMAAATQAIKLDDLNSDAITTDVNNKIADTQNGLARLQQELAELKNTYELPIAANPEQAFTPEQIEAQAIEQQILQTQLLENTLMSEASDPDWSISAEEQVRSGIDKVEAELTINDLVCASTVCKLEASSKSNDPAEVFRSMDQHLAWDGEIYMTINLDEGHTTAWLGRPGESLPRANNGTN